MPNDYNYNFQADEPARNETLAVGTSSITASEKRNNLQPRKAITFRNTSSNSTDIITLNIGSNPAVANQGIVLRQYEHWTESSDSDYECWQGKYTAICATATGQLSVMER